MRTKDRYLKLRGKQWHICMPVPKAAQGLEGRTLIQQSLKTSDIALARRRRDDIEASFVRRWRMIDDALTAKHLTDREVELAVYLRGATEGGDDAEFAKEMASDEACSLDNEGRNDAAIEFYGIATGSISRTRPAIEEFLDRATLKDSTKRQYRSALNSVCEQFATLQTVDRASARRFLQRYAETRTKSAVQNLIAACKSLYAFHGVDASVWEGHKTYPGKANVGRGRWTDDEMRKLIDAASVIDARMADVLTVAFYSGFRRQELAGLVYDSERDHLIVMADNSKTDNSWRRVPCHSKAREAAKRLVHDSLSVHMISSRMPEVIAKAGCEKMAVIDGKPLKRDLHTIRHTFSCKLAEAGVDELSLSRLMGHAPNNVTRMYSGKIDPETLRPHIERLNYGS